MHYAIRRGVNDGIKSDVFNEKLSRKSVFVQYLEGNMIITKGLLRVSDVANLSYLLPFVCHVYERFNVNCHHARLPEELALYFSFRRPK